MKKIILLIIAVLFLYGCTDEEIKKEETIKIDIGEKKILALGDSLTAGYNLDIKDSYPSQLQETLRKNGYNYEIINAGVSGDTSKNLLSRLNLYEDDYEIVLLNIGGNDGLRSLSLEELESNIAKIIENFRESKIVLFSIDLPMNYGLRYRRELKDVYENIEEENNIYFYGLFFEGLDYSKHFLSDGLHPNKSGYKIIAENIYNYILENNLIKND